MYWLRSAAAADSAAIFLWFICAEEEKLVSMDIAIGGGWLFLVTAGAMCLSIVPHTHRHGFCVVFVLAYVFLSYLFFVFDTLTELILPFVLFYFPLR